MGAMMVAALLCLAASLGLGASREPLRDERLRRELAEVRGARAPRESER
jgi:hypothetical protein